MEEHNRILSELLSEQRKTNQRLKSILTVVREIGFMIAAGLFLAIGFAFDIAYVFALILIIVLGSYFYGEWKKMDQEEKS